MRHLGIDFGSKKIGLALSDEMGQMAFPLKVVPNDKLFFEELVSLIKKEQVKVIVIGHSLDKEGRENKIHQAVETLMLDLTLSVGLPVFLEPEQFTTQAALRLQGKNKQTDASAAALILDGYLRKNKNN